MKLFNTHIITASALLAATPYASAHEGNTAATLYHYFSSPDHVAIFAVLATSAVVTGLYVTGFRSRTVKLKKK